MEIKTFGVGDKVWYLSRLMPGAGLPHIKKGDCSLHRVTVEYVNVGGKALNSKKTRWTLDVGYGSPSSHVYMNYKDVFPTIKAAHEFAKKNGLRIKRIWKKGELEKLSKG